MKSDRFIDERADREFDRLEAFVRKPQDATTPQQKLVRAAETGGFEAIVAAAQPAEPPKMVTPEEREAELARAGKAFDEPKAKRKPAPKPEPKEPARPLTPNEQFIDENCRWVARGSGIRRPTHNPYRCLTEYNVLTGEIIGDGYDPRFKGNDA